jgi:transposase
LPRKHPPEVRERALVLVEQVGMNEAARRLGISRGTLYTWQHPEQAAKFSAMASVRQNKARCPRCGGPKRRDNGEVCRRCKSANAWEVRRRRDEGQSLFSISLALGLTVEQVKSHLLNDRRRGRPNLP